MIQGVADAGHISHGIQGAHLVIVDVSHRAAVGFGLSFCNVVVDGASGGTDFLRQGQAVDDLRNMPRRGVMVGVAMVVTLSVEMVVTFTVGVVMVVLMVMAVHMVMGMAVQVGFLAGFAVAVGGGSTGFDLLLTMDGHCHVGRPT